MTHSVEWAAGFFEGEGSASYYQKTGQNCMRLQLATRQVDREVLDVFQRVVEAGRVTGPYGPYKGQLNKKPIYEWKAVGMEAIRVADLLLPYLFAKGRQLAPKLQAYKNYKEALDGSVNTAGGHLCPAG